MSKKWIIFFIVIIILLAISLFVKNAQAFNYNACGEGDAGDQNPHCVPTSTPTPTIKICNEDHPCITPTCTPNLKISPTAGESATPTATPSATNTPNNSGSQGGTGVSDGRHQSPDGLGCAVHDCSPHAAPNTGHAE